MEGRAMLGVKKPRLLVDREKEDQILVSSLPTTITNYHQQTVVNIPGPYIARSGLTHSMTLCIPSLLLLGSTCAIQVVRFSGSYQNTSRKCR